MVGIRKSTIINNDNFIPSRYPLLFVLVPKSREFIKIVINKIAIFKTLNILVDKILLEYKRVIIRIETIKEIIVDVREIKYFLI